MIALEDARARLLALAHPVGIEEVAVAEAIGRFVASDCTARRTQPARDLSAMDGYAIDANAGTGPWTLVAESAAGRPFRGTVSQGETVRIFTGAALPMGTNAVIMQEDVLCEKNVVSMEKLVELNCGKHVRLTGSDFAAGDVLVERGTRLTPANVGLLAQAGCVYLAVHRKIKVALLSTGDELLPIGTPCDDAHIPASNAAMIAALLSSLPTDTFDLGIVPDSLPLIVTAITDVHYADILVTIGGASVGDHDLVHPALIEAGAKVDFWRVAMRPGKPVLAGTRGKQVILGLPGNPVSAYVTARLLLLPLIAAFSAASQPLPEERTARLGASLPANGNRIDHVRALLREGIATPLTSQDSAGLLALSRANALIIRAPHAPPATEGDQVFVLDA